MTADFHKMDAGEVEFEGKQQESTEGHKSPGGGEGAGVGEKEELMDDSYVYVDKELADQSEVVVSDENIDRDRRSDCLVQPIKNAELEGVLEDVRDLNSDVADDAVTEIPNVTHVDHVPGLNAEVGDSNSDGQVHEVREIESSSTVSHGLETDAGGGSLDSSDGLLCEGKELESPATVTNGLDLEAEGLDADSDVRVTYMKGSESPVLGNHMSELNDVVMSFSDDTKEGESPVLVDCDAKLDGEIVDSGSDERKELGSPVFTNDGVELNSESEVRNSDDRAAEVKDINSPLVNHGKEPNYEVGDPCSDGKGNEVMEVESLEHPIEVQELHADGTDLNADVNSPLVNHGKESNYEVGDPCSDEKGNEVMEVESLEYPIEVQELHANGTDLNADVPPDDMKAAEPMETLELHAESGDLNLDGCNVRQEIGSLAFVNGVLGSDAVMDNKVNVTENTEFPIPSYEVSGSKFQSYPEDAESKQIEENYQIEQTGDGNVSRVLDSGLKVEEPIHKEFVEPLNENVEDVRNSEVPPNACEKQDCTLETGLEKEAEENLIVSMERSEHIEDAHMAYNSKTVLSSTDTVEVESAFTSIQDETAELNVFEDHERKPVVVDMEGNPKEDIHITEEVEICKETLLPSSAEDSASLSEPHEEKPPLSFDDSKSPSQMLVATNLDASSPSTVEEAQLLVSSSHLDEITGKSSITTSIPEDSVSPGSSCKLGEELYVNGVSPYIPECPVIFGSFSHLGGAFSINGISPLPERSNASSSSGQSDERIHMNGTASIVDVDSSTSSSPLVEEITTTATTSDEQRIDAQPGKKPVYAIIRIPRPVDNKVKERIRQAQLQVDDLTQKRDAINALVQSKQAARHEIWGRLRVAKSELRASREVQLAKRKEMESIQSVMNKMRTATSVEEYDERIYSMQHRLEHETVPLKVEKQLIREIKQLKLARDKLSVDMGGQSELDEAFDHKEEIERKFKLLEQEIDSLRKELVRTDAHTKSIEKELNGLDEEIVQLRAQVGSANNVRQEAYLSLKNLKQQEYEKNTLFYQNRTDIQVAHQHADAKDREALLVHCGDQVERIMELWNRNDDFRKEYIKNNEFSTLRRLGTLDGRALGPDEEPLLSRRRTENESSVNQLPLAEKGAVLPGSASETLVGGHRQATVVKASAEIHVEKAKKSSSSQARKTGKSTLTEGTPTMFVKEELEEETEREEKKPSQEEVQRLIQEEEQRKVEAAARLKEQRRLEEIAKAKEAEARKRRNAEKVKARSEVRAQKEAERREKEREKRARKKAAAAAAATASVGAEDESESLDKQAAESTSTPEYEMKERQESAAVAAKKPARPHQMLKSSKPKSLVPPPLRKNRRKVQPWMYGLLIGGIVTLVLAFVVQRLYF